MAKNRWRRSLLRVQGRVGDPGWQLDSIKRVRYGSSLLLYSSTLANAPTLRARKPIPQLGHQPWQPFAEQRKKR